MKKILTIIALALTLTACGVAPDQATRTLSAMGMTDIEIGGYALFGCGKDDSFSSTFTATGATGQPISGVVCGGMFKGLTVRFD